MSQHYDFTSWDDLLGALILGDSFCAFRDGVLRKLTRKDEAYSGLYASSRHGFLLVVFAQSSCLSRNPTKSIGHERVQDGHGSLRNPGVRVNLLENPINVNVIGFTVSSSDHLEIFS